MDVKNLHARAASELLEKIGVPMEREAKAVDLIGLNSINKGKVARPAVARLQVRDCYATARAVYVHRLEAISSFGIFDPLKVRQAAKQ
ncbi:MAG: hypothetical protein ACHQZS_11785 [Candidatus Binatales bacterium]